MLRSVAVNAGTAAEHAQFSVDLVGRNSSFPPGRVVGALFTIGGRNYAIDGQHVTVAAPDGSAGTVTATKVAPQHGGDEISTDVSIAWRCS